MTTDVELARTMARQTGRALLEMRTGFGPVAPDDEQALRALRDSGDQLAQGLLAAELAKSRPGDAVLSEEAPDTVARLSAQRVWIIDPLDGTEEFGLGRADFAVHVALWQRHPPQGDPARGEQPGSLTDAAVDVPAIGETWTTADGNHPRELPADRPLRMLVSRTRPPAGLDALLAAATRALAEHGITDLGIEAANVGSVGAKVGEVLAGRGEAYLHPGGLNEWDLAAPYACARAAGLVALGWPQPFNLAPPRCGPVLLCHPAIADVLAGVWSPTGV